ncbi:MAG TPA: metal ABC transporter substrate-binding protein [Thermodesulfobacteriota bacterium]|nr:metal ABC transporter substrate-binding protein [Thermodesulfobacteriota bacterium]
MKTQKFLQSLALHFCLALLVIAFSLFASAIDALAKVKVVASLPTFAAITKEIGGDKVEVESLAKGYQDPHFVDAKPSYVLKLNRADLLIYNGLDLEIGWLPPLITGSRNSKITSTNSPGNLNASTLISNILEVPTMRVDRSMGDIHPGGNPHYILDPKNGIAVANGIAERLKEIDPKNSSYYDQRLKDFVKRLNAKAKEWEEKLAPYKGTKIVPYHKSWNYFSDWAGFQEVGYVEPKPGIPPSPSYVADLIRKIQGMNVKLVIAESYYPQKVPALIAQKAGASFLVLPAQVGGGDGINTYFDLLDAIVNDVTSKLENMKQAVNSSNLAGG